MTYDSSVKAWKVFLALDAVVLAAAAVAFMTLHGQGPRTVRTGVVLVDANLGHGNRTEGTGIVLTGSGEVLTNNHVIEGATSVRVTVPQSGRTYDADILGYDVHVDVALLRLRHAHALRRASTLSRLPRVGQEVLAVGGSSGTVEYTVGHITGLRKSVTAGDDTGGRETLRGMIEFDAGVEPGDSGGPLFDVRGNVLGVDTAGSEKTNFFDLLRRDHDSYAIPVGDALAVVHDIEDGRVSTTLHVGPTGFLGIELDPRSTRSGALVAVAVPGSPAERVGLRAGSLITAADGHAITSPEQIVSLLIAKRPGDRVAFGWTDRTGMHTAAVTLVPGPAL
jgi:S1-C subfamily serine protease